MRCENGAPRRSARDAVPRPLRGLRAATGRAVLHLPRRGPAGRADGRTSAAPRGLGSRLRVRGAGTRGIGPPEIPQRPVCPAGPGCCPRRTARGGGFGPDRCRHLAADHRRPAPGAGLRPGRASGAGRRPEPRRAGTVVPRPAGRALADRSVGRGAPPRAGLRVGLSVRVAGAGGRRRGHHGGDPGSGRPGPPVGWCRVGGRRHGGPHTAPHPTAANERCGSFGPGSRPSHRAPRPPHEPRFGLRAGRPRKERKKSRWTVRTP